MRATANSDATSAQADTGRLRVELCDALAANMGLLGPEQQAEFFEIHRSTYYRLRNGDRIASLPTALRMAKRLGTTVQTLFMDEVA